MSTRSSAAPTVRRGATFVRWKGREFDVGPGIDVLMNVVRNPEVGAEPWNAATALGELSDLRTQLQGRACLDELAKLYDNASDLEKQGILICFQGSEDPRGIPIFIRTLDNPQNLKPRVWAAGALAQWNIRRGVAELVNLLESEDTMPQPSQIFYVRDNALDLFETKSRLKGWGFPAGEIRKSIEARTDLTDDQKPIVYFDEMKREIKKWFAENEQHFPEWKLGDALPEITPPEQEARP
ncbi:MAG: hypothetical protein AABZ47_00265 [Planctomycetota bacterium]